MYVLSYVADPPRGFASYRFTTYQDARRVRLVDGLVDGLIFETNILRVSPVNFASCYLEKVMKRQWGSRRDTMYVVLFTLSIALSLAVARESTWLGE